MSIIINKNKSLQAHPYHLVEPSPWPLGASISMLILTLGGVMKFHGYVAGDICLPLGILLVLATMILWWSNVIKESTYQGEHTTPVKMGITLGIILFIISEIMLFISLFWAYFHSSLSPSIELGSSWPPIGIATLNPYEIPLLNTLLLLTSGATVTVSHTSIISGNRNTTILYLLLTILLASTFLGYQFVEYNNAPFTLTDSVFGSSFYMVTGLHGLHVLIGTIFLTISLIRILNYEVTVNHHLGMESAIWYWHFCDIVWLFVFIFIYIWGTL